MGMLANARYIKKMPSQYSKSQVLEWLTLIGYDVTSKVQSDVENDTFQADLENLTILMRLHIVGIPFENTEMHYSPAHHMAVEPQELFKRLVKERNGSYCIGKTGLLFQMLRALGYRIYPVTARINKMQSDLSAPPIFTPTTHMVLIVQPLPDSNTTYLVDAGLGAAGPVRPILLEEGSTVQGSTPTEKHRLSKGFIPLSSTESLASQVWQLECVREKEGEQNPWELLYVFDEVERYQVDFECMNHYVATFGPGSTIFAEHVIAVKHFWLDKAEEIERRHMGTVTLLGDRVRRNMGPRSVSVRELQTEEERIEALEEYFGVKVQRDWLSNIRGREAALN